MTSRPSTAAPILAALAIVLVLLGAYVGGYFWLGERVGVIEEATIFAEESSIVRVYPKWWLARAFAPAAYVETWLGKLPVAVDSKDAPDRQGFP
jgi:hypothetical protein